MRARPARGNGHDGECAGWWSHSSPPAELGLLLWVAPLAKVIAQIGHMQLRWVIATVALEIGSCLSYVVVFRRLFPEPPRGVSHRVAWMAMGAGAILPGGNISSAAATGWLLRRHGVGTRRLLERCAALLCLLTAFGSAINGLAGVLLLIARLPGGPHDLSHTGIPILVSVGVLSTAAVVALAIRRVGEGAPRFVRGVAVGLEGGSQAVGDSTLAAGRRRRASCAWTWARCGRHAAPPGTRSGCRPW